MIIYYKYFKKMKKIKFLVMLLLVTTVSDQAQVTIGGKKNPSPFSILELVSGSESNNGNRGLRLPQLTTAQRNSISGTYGAQAAMQGLQIFNTNTQCVETWNGSEWIQQCYNNTPVTPVTVGKVGLCLIRSGAGDLTYTYSVAPPYATPASVEFLGGTTSVGVYTAEPFEHTFDEAPIGEVTVVMTYPPFAAAGAKPADQTIIADYCRCTNLLIILTFK
jgi:hypothetical protein